MFKIWIMNKYLIILSAVALAGILLAAGCARRSKGPAIVGKVDVYEGFASKYVEARSIRVWTPEGYDPAVKFDVIYMHDGQNLYDHTSTWNHQEWGVDEVLTALMAEGKVRPAIVVGIDNSQTLRFEEYYPSRIVAEAPAGLLPEDFKPLGDEYLRFIVEEVKPYVDSLYSTLGDPAHTFVMGSSCGGLISAYALCEHPEVFGGAACLSTHSTLEMPGVKADMSPMAEAFLGYLRDWFPRGGTHLLYMDCGDRTIDATYKDTQAAIDELMDTLQGEGERVMHRHFPGAAHCERDWQARLDVPLVFLIGVDKV